MISIPNPLYSSFKIGYLSVGGLIASTAPRVLIIMLPVDSVESVDRVEMTWLNSKFLISAGLAGWGD